MVTLHNLPEHLAANTWVILKIAIISFFIVNCWPYAVESALLNFAKNTFIILPYTHDIHVLAVHVEMSLFMILNKLNRLSPEPLCLTFKIHSQESNLHGAELTSISADVIPQNSGVGALGGPAPAAQIGAQIIPRRFQAVNVYPGYCWMLRRPCCNYSVCFKEMVVICLKGFHSKPRVHGSSSQLFTCECSPQKFHLKPAFFWFSGGLLPFHVGSGMQNNFSVSLTKT